ncbi:MAG: ASCH domain-containing protein [Thiomicrorhabdus sp.]|nr:ASCH domain-containing protein [Thiomicrorhabdus sp.]
MNKVQKAFLDKHFEGLKPEKRNRHQRIVADYFCADESNANMCADLIVRGEKTATCSLKYWYESGLEPMPKIGDLQVVTDWEGNPTSIIEITDVFECPFSEVTAELAALEGEGDKSLDWWRKTHWEFFSTECTEQGLQPSNDMVLVFEKFKVVYV